MKFRPYIQTSEDKWIELDVEQVNQENFKFKGYLEQYTDKEKIKVFFDLDITNLFTEKEFTEARIDAIIHANFKNEFIILTSHRNTDKGYKVSYHFIHRFKVLENVKQVHKYVLDKYKKKVIDFIGDMYEQAKNTKCVFTIDQTKLWFDESIYRTGCFRSIYQYKILNPSKDHDNSYFTPLMEIPKIEDTLLTYTEGKLVESYEEYKSIIDLPKQVSNDIEKQDRIPNFNLLMKLADLIDNKLVDTNDDWIKILWTFKSLSEAFPDKNDDIFDKFVDVSMRTKNKPYSYSKIINDWNNRSIKSNGITWKSMYKWAKICSPDKYKELVPEIISDRNSYPNRKIFLSNDYSFLYPDFSAKYANKEIYKDHNEIKEMLLDLQKVFGFVDAGKCTYVIKTYDADRPEIEYLTSKIIKSDSILGKEIKYYAEDIPTNLKKPKMIKTKIIKYLVKYQRMMFLYDRIIFNPDVFNGSTENLNLFCGYNARYLTSYDKNNEGLKLFKEYLYNIISNRDDANYKFMLQYLGSLLKKPSERTNVCLCLYSQKTGTGKNTLFTIIGNYIMGERYIAEFTDLDDIINKFNGIMTNKIISVMNEATSVESNSKKIWNKLKSMITEKKWKIELKGVDATMNKNFNNLVILTNYKDSIKLDIYDRRYALFEISSERSCDEEYFINLKTKCKESINEIFTFLCDNYEEGLGNQIMIPLTPWKKELLLVAVPYIWKFLKNYVTRIEELSLKTPRNIFKLYEEWCSRIHKTIYMNEQTFGKNIKRLGFEQHKQSKSRVYDITEHSIKKLYEKTNYRITYDELDMDNDLDDI